MPADTERLPSAWRRRALWTALTALVVALLATLVWLAGRYEASQVQSRLERDVADAVGDIRSALSRNVQSLQALQFNDPTPAAWSLAAAALLREHRELVRIEWRDSNQKTRVHADTPFRPAVYDRLGRDSVQTESARPAPRPAGSAHRPIPAVISCP